jgi:hypothetical protein
VSAAPQNIDGRATRALVLAPIVAVAAIDAGYVAIIRSQPDQRPDVLAVPFVACYLALMTVLLVASLFDLPMLVRLRPALRAAGAAGLLVLGVVALFSIGLPIFLAGSLVTAATVMTLVTEKSRDATASAVAAAVLAVAVLLVGSGLTSRYIVCPGTGEMAVTTGLVTGGFSYECRDGQLTTTSS